MIRIYNEIILNNKFGKSNNKKFKTYVNNFKECIN